MAKPTIGHVACPCCGEDADIREQKNGRSYLLCNSPVCGFQGFARSNDADKNLRSKMKPLTAPAADPKPAQAATPNPEPPKRKGFFDDLYSF